MGVDEKLDKKAIWAHFSPLAREAIAQIDIVETLSSTNTYLLEQRKQGLPSGSICLAECQTAGRGRQGRIWHSPRGNLFFSLYWQFPCKAFALEGITLVAGLAVLEAFATLVSPAHPLRMKWPNDIVHHHKKLGGILTEISTPSLPGCTEVVFGVGLNGEKEGMPSEGTCCVDVFGRTFSRNHMVAALCNTLVPWLISYPQEGFASFQKRWAIYDSLLEQRVRWERYGEVGTGIALGVNERGELSVQTETSLLLLREGEVTRLRAQEEEAARLSLGNSVL